MSYIYTHRKVRLYSSFLKKGVASKSIQLSNEEILTFNGRCLTNICGIWTKMNELTVLNIRS